MPDSGPGDPAGTVAASTRHGCTNIWRGLRFATTSDLRGSHSSGTDVTRLYMAEPAVTSAVALYTWKIGKSGQGAI